MSTNCISLGVYRKKSVIHDAKNLTDMNNCILSSKSQNVKQRMKQMDDMAYEFQILQHRCNDAFRISPDSNDDTLCKELEHQKNKLLAEINRLQQTLYARGGGKKRRNNRPRTRNKTKKRGTRQK